MSSKKKKILSALLASSMLVSQVSVVAFAEATEPTYDLFTYTAPASLTYDGIAKVASVTKADENNTNLEFTVKYSTKQSSESPEEADFFPDAPKNAGTYYVYACVTGNSTYNEKAVQVGSFTISAATPAAGDFTFTAPESLTYDGSEKSATVEKKSGVTGMGAITVEYYDKDGNKLESAPKNAGEYTVKVTTAAGENYAAATTPIEVGSFTIEKAEISEIAINDIAAPSGGTALATSATSANTALSLSTIEWKPTASDGNAAYNQAYTASITVSLKDSANYKFADSVSATIGESAATSCTKEGDNYKVTKDFAATAKESVSAVTLTGVDAPVAGANVPTIGVDSGANGKYSIESTTWYTVGEEDTEFTDEKFGANTSYKVVIVLAPGENCAFAESVNVTGVDGVSPVAPNGETGKVTIEKTFAATGSYVPTYTAPTANTLKYISGTQQALVTAGTVTGGTFQYRLGESGGFAADIPTAENAGEYKVYYKIVGDDENGYGDIETPDPEYVTVTIAKADVELEAPTASAIEYGETLANSTLSGDWKWTSGETKPNVANEGFEAYLDVSATDDNYDYAAFAEANEGYTYSSSEHKLKKTVAVTVTPKEIEISVNANGTFTYDGTAKTFETVTVTYKDGDKDITLKASTEDTPGDYIISYFNNINAGVNTAYCSIDPESDGNYTFIPSGVVFTIAQAEPEITVTESQTANKGTGAFVAPTANVDGAFEYEIGGQKYTESALKTYLSEQDAGDITINYTFKPTDSTNYAEKNGTISYKVVELTFYVGETAVGGENPAVTVKKDAPVYGDDWTDIIQVNVNGAKIGDTAAQEGATFTLDVSGKPNAGEQTYKVLFNGTIGGETYTDIVVYTRTVTVAPKPVTVSAGTKAKISKVYDGTSDVNTKICKFTEDFVINGLEAADEGKVSVEIYGIGKGGFGTSDVTDTAKVIVGVKLIGEAAGNYKLGEYGTAGVEVPGEITQRTITPTATVSGTYTYTGSVVTPGDDKVVVKFTDKDFMGGAEQTLELTKDYTFVGNTTNAGKATITISPVASSNFKFTAFDAEFEIAAADLKVSGEGTATGTYGTALSGLSISGLTAKIGETPVEGTWAITGAGSDVVPNVGDTAEYAATFTPSETAVNYNTLTAKVKLSITKATYGTVQNAAISVKYNNTGKDITAQLNLPAIDGIAFKEIKDTSDSNTILSAAPSCDDKGVVTFRIAADKVADNSATVTFTFTSTNYADFDAALVITLSAKEDQAAPEGATMTAADDGKGNYTVTINAPATIPEGATVEYSFDGKAWSTTKNTQENVAANTTVNGYIRYAEGTYNASPAVALSVTTPKAASAAPTITPSEATTFTDSIEVEISTADPSAVIYYTLDGKDPTTSSTQYTGKIKITSTTTVKAIAVNYGKDPSSVVSVKFTKQSTTPSNPGGSGGSGGGSSSGGSSSTTTPSVDGKETTWTDVAKDISKLTEDKTQTIDLNGSTTVPVEVVKAIATSNAEVTLKVDDVFSWTIDGSDIDAKDAKAANLSITKATVTGTSALRGTVGTGFTIKGTNVKSELNINFKATNAGKFANLFKKVDGKLVFVDNVKVDKNGAAIGLEVSEKGEYVVMLGKYSDRAGDMDNDGIMNTKDSLAILKDFLDIESGENPVVADINGDGYINAKDALEVLIAFLNLK